MNKTIKPLLTIFSISTLLLLFLGVVGGCTKVEVSTGGGGTDICVGQDTLDCSDNSNDGDDDNTSNDGDDDNTDTDTETDSGNETTTN
jgi:hypothetical protein